MERISEAPIYKGDPRQSRGDMNTWLTRILEDNPASIVARPYLYGSDAGFCSRRNVLLEHNQELSSTINAAGYAYMAIGVALENLLADSLRKAGLLIAQGNRIIDMPELKISGKFDLVVTDSQGELAILEVKTCGDLPKEPKPNHLAQLQTYCAVTGIQKGWLVYLSRKLIPLKPVPLHCFQADTGPEALLGVLHIAAFSRILSDLALLPPKPATFRKHTECHYCEFRDYYCWEEGGTPPVPEGSVAELVQANSQAAALAARLLASAPERLERTKRELGLAAPA